MLAIPRVSVRMIGRSGPIFASSNFSRARLHKAMQGSVQEGKRWQSQLCTFFQMGKCFLENRSTYHLHNRRVSPSHIFGLHWFANNKYGKSVKYHLVQCVQLTWCEHEGKMDEKSIFLGNMQSKIWKSRYHAQRDFLHTFPHVMLRWSLRFFIYLQKFSLPIIQREIIEN